MNPEEIGGQNSERYFEKRWNEEVQAFTQYYDSSCPDAANLLMEHFGFMNASDEKYVRTVEKKP